MKLEEIEKLCEEATPGPWEAQIPAMTGEWPKARIWPLKIEGKLYHYAMIKTADAEFIAASRTLMPKLLQIAKLAKASNYGTTMLDTLKELEKE